MRTRIYRGKVFHTRTKPVQHSFAYPIYVVAFDINELHQIDKFSPIFGYKKFGLLSLRDSDYLRSESGDFPQRLKTILGDKAASGITNISLITTPRFFGYAFNPVSFFVCYGNDSSIKRVLAEVHNTFGESYVYNLEASTNSTNEQSGKLEFDKRFYVSPFFDSKGDYKLQISKFEEELDISVELKKEGQNVFSARLTGKKKEFTLRNLALTLILFPLAPLVTMLRIELEALRLYFLKKLNFTLKPEVPTHPLSSDTPTMFDRMRSKIVRYMRSRRLEDEHKPGL